MSNLFVKESYINRTRDACYGETDVYETAYANLGDLYRALAKEYGRCTCTVHIDRKDAAPLTVGWVFVQRVKYDDSDKTYLRETWVTVYAEKPAVSVKLKYAEV